MINAELVKQMVAQALEEDLGSGDRTAALVPVGPATARLICRQQAILAGSAWFEQAFVQLDPEAVVRWHLQDGGQMQAGQEVCVVQAQARALLSAERTALNFLQTLSATATQAAAYVAAIAGTGARILDTRKTLPGMRLAQKYAVTCGGAANHRMGLYDAVLIKENHVAAAGSVTAALRQAQQLAAEIKIQIEVENLSELEEALAAGARHVLLDNFDLQGLRQAVALNAGRARLEASGGVSLAGVRDIALTGVDDISVGSITKDVAAVDYSLLVSELLPGQPT